MPLEIQEDAIASVHEGAHHVRTFGREQSAADLEAANGAAQSVGERDGLGARLHVERN